MVADIARITNDVKEIIKNQLDVEDARITPKASFIDDLGADSLALVELVLAFEEKFAFEIPDEDTQKLRTVEDVIQYVQQHSEPS